MNRPWHFLIIGLFVLLLDFIFHFMLLTKIIMAHVDDTAFLCLWAFSINTTKWVILALLREIVCPSILLSICSFHICLSFYLFSALGTFAETYTIQSGNEFWNFQIRVQSNRCSLYKIFVLSMFSFPLAQSGPKRLKEISVVSARCFARTYSRKEEAQEPLSKISFRWKFDDIDLFEKIGNNSWKSKSMTFCMYIDIQCVAASFWRSKAAWGLIGSRLGHDHHSYYFLRFLPKKYMGKSKNRQHNRC